ncbi:MAG: hypothetical protein E3J72_10365 [Planctomycetota bacterium]|nr:MAG: hypothetical protein E3J72_10365 [Planctomycetota bacterium]
MKKIIWTVLALMAITFGALFGVYKHWLKVGKLSNDTGFFAFLSGSGRVQVAEQTDKEGEGEAKPAGRRRESDRSRRGTGRSRPGEVARGTGDRPEIGVVTPPFDSRTFDKLKREGELAYANGKYGEAEEKFKDAADLAKTSKKDNLAYPLERRAMRSKVFRALVSKIQVEPISDGKDVAEISLTFGGRKPFIAKIIEENKTSIKIEKESGIGATFEKDDIDSIKRLTRDEYRAHLNKQLDTEYRDVTKGGKPDYLGLYQCVYFAARFNLAGRITSLLEETFKTEDSQGLISIFCPEDPVSLTVALLRSYGKDTEAQKILDEHAGAIAMAEPDERRYRPYREPEEDTTSSSSGGISSGYREPESAPDEEELERLPERSPDEVEGNDGRGWRRAPEGEDEGPEESLEDEPEEQEPASNTNPLDADPDYRRAMKLYNDALKYYRRSFPGMPMYVKQLKKALPLMQEVQDLLNRVQQRFPESLQLDNIMQQVTRIIYDIIKRTPLDR